MNPKQQNNKNNRTPQTSGLRSSRGSAIRAQKRAQEDAQRVLNQFVDTPASQSNEQAPRANLIDDRPQLRIVGLGGMDGAGSKNMLVVEYMNDAVIMDCGNDLSVDLPGIN